MAGTDGEQGVDATEVPSMESPGEGATQAVEARQVEDILTEIDVAQRKHVIQKRDNEWREVLQDQGIAKDGVTIYGSKELSDPDVKVVLCLAGFTQTGKDVYGDIAKQLGEDSNIVVVMLSTPGSVGTTFTEKSLKSGTYNAEAYADLANALLANLGREKADVVVGHSLGGAAASLMEVENRVLLAPAFRTTRKFQTAIRALQMTPPWLKSLTPPFLRKGIVSLLMGPKVPGEFADQYAEQLFDKLDPKAIGKVFEPLTKDILPKETQLATGNTVAFIPSKDRIVDGTYGMEVVASFPNVKVQHPEGGHNVHMNRENGEEVVRVIREMLG